MSNWIYRDSNIPKWVLHDVMIHYNLKYKRLPFNWNDIIFKLNTLNFHSTARHLHILTISCILRVYVLNESVWPPLYILMYIVPQNWKLLKLRYFQFTTTINLTTASSRNCNVSFLRGYKWWSTYHLRFWNYFQNLITVSV